MLKKTMVLAITVLTSLNVSADCIAAYNRDLKQIGGGNASEKTQEGAIVVASSMITTAAALGNRVRPAAAITTGAAPAGAVVGAVVLSNAQLRQSLTAAKQLIEESKIGAGLQITKMTAEINLSLAQAGYATTISADLIAQILNSWNNENVFCSFARAYQIEKIKELLISNIHQYVNLQKF
ncbi:MAG: hypothetical protein V4654_14460 [Bdellovibrionota bacterium]